MLAFLKEPEKRTLLFLALSLVSLAASFFAPDTLLIDPAWAAILLCGVPIVKGAVVGLATAFDIKADVLVSIALIAAVAVGEHFAAGEIALIMALGAYLEERTVSKARDGIEKLVRLTPDTARVVRGETETIIPAGQICEGDILRVLAGETIAADGIIVRGQTSVNQAVMTGESLPVDKGEGDEVQSGTVNQFGAFDMEARKVGADSSLHRMIRLLESADAGKAKIVRLADRWATWIVIAALTAAAITWIMTGAVIRAVTILVVFCPCSLVLATPTAITAGIGNAAKHGILVRQGDALERLDKTTRIAFDKTGTLTCGRPAVVQTVCFEPQLSEREFLRFAAGAEMRSEHPLGKAVAAHYQETYGEQPPQPEAFALLPGRGVSAQVNGQALLAGSAALCEEHGASLPEEYASRIQKAKQEGCTIIYVLRSGGMLGYIALADTLRPDAPATVKSIQDAGASTVLLTGDASQAAGHIAAQAGIADVRSECRPEEKLRFIRACQEEGIPVCMVGDGVNDAPSLKAAHVGIAMGGVGSDIAIDAADIVLVGDDIREIPHLLRLSHRLMRTVKVNLSASMLLNFAAVILAITGILTPVAGALVHNAGSVAVILNSARLLNWRKKEP